MIILIPQETSGYFLNHNFSFIIILSEKCPSYRLLFSDQQSQTYPIQSSPKNILAYLINQSIIKLVIM